MTGYLLDTNIVLIALTRPATLSPRVRKAILTGPNVLSVLVYWEVVLKVMKGTLVVGQPRAWWLDSMDMLAASVLPLAPAHIAASYDLPPIHKDPFDRMFVSQAQVEGLTLVTRDRDLRKYKSKQIRILM